MDGAQTFGAAVADWLGLWLLVQSLTSTSMPEVPMSKAPNLSGLTAPWPPIGGPMLRVSVCLPH